jgi:hypothetical protein
MLENVQNFVGALLFSVETQQTIGMGHLTWLPNF